MTCKLLELAIFFAIVNISRSSESNLSIPRNQHDLINKEAMHKSIFPNIKKLLKEKEDNRQKFLRMIDEIDDNDYNLSEDTPFTIIIPKFNFDVSSIEKKILRDLVFEHIIPGVQIKTLKSGDAYGNLNHNKIIVKNSSPEIWTVNDVNVLKFNNIPSKQISLVEIDGYLIDRNSSNSKRNIKENNRYNEPEKLVQRLVNKSDLVHKEPKLSYLQNYLSSMKSGTKVFQHFLANSNLSQIFEDTKFTYIILIPSDSAFQRWHPIDWGFYPFSVPEFTENILRNHVIELQQKLPFNIKSVEKEKKLKTLGGDYVNFRIEPLPSVNNVSILSNATLPNGNELFIVNEVLFMSESIVSKLHQQNKDKETPPLLAFPWFGSQFLSHAFLALERDNRFTQITRFLSSAEIASSIVGSNYTFFVPSDDAFEKYGFDLLPDETLSSDKGLKLILNHFVKGRLYARDLEQEKVFETVGGKHLKISKDQSEQIFVNHAKIVESEIFVYNLGTMFYVDDVLYPENFKNELKTITQTPSQNKERENESAEDSYTTEITIFSESGENLSTRENREPTTSEYRSMLSVLLTTRSDVELVPIGFSETAEEFSVGANFITSKAMSKQQPMAPPKK